MTLHETTDHRARCARCKRLAPLGPDDLVDTPERDILPDGTLVDGTMPTIGDTPGGWHRGPNGELLCGGPDCRVPDDVEEWYDRLDETETETEAVGVEPARLGDER